MLVKIFIDVDLFVKRMHVEGFSTQKSVAYKANVSPLTVHKALNGHGIHSHTAMKLAKALKIDKDKDRDYFYKIFKVERTPSKKKA